MQSAEWPRGKGLKGPPCLAHAPPNSSLPSLWCPRSKVSRLCPGGMCTHIHTHAITHICSHMCPCTHHAHIHTCAHMPMHTHTCTHVPTRALTFLHPHALRDPRHSPWRLPLSCLHGRWPLTLHRVGAPVSGVPTALQASHSPENSQRSCQSHRTQKLGKEWAVHWRPVWSVSWDSVCPQV